MHPFCSFPSLHSSQDPLFLFSKEQDAEFPMISTRHILTSYNKTRHKSSCQDWTTPFLLFGVPQKPKLNKHSVYVEDLAQTHTCSMIAASVSLNPFEPYLVNSVGQVLLVQ